MFTLSSQNKISIKFKDGTEIHGYGRIKADHNILYRSDKGAKKETYGFKTVRKLTVYEDGHDDYYEYKLVVNFGLERFKLLKIAKAGTVSLYEQVMSGRTNPHVTGGFSTSYSSVKYYISKIGSNRATDLREGNTYSKRFREIAEKYFGDCSDLMDKIKTRKFFKRYGIHAIVNYYNKECK